MQGTFHCHNSESDANTKPFARSRANAHISGWRDQEVDCTKELTHPDYEVSDGAVLAHQPYCHQGNSDNANYTNH